MPAPPVVAPTIVALDHLHQELSAGSADVRKDGGSCKVPAPCRLVCRCNGHTPTTVVSVPGKQKRWVVSLCVPYKRRKSCAR